MVVIDGLTMPFESNKWVKNRSMKNWYDGWKMVDVLVSRDGMTADEAYEFIEYNVEGSYVGMLIQSSCGLSMI